MKVKNKGIIAGISLIAITGAIIYIRRRQKANRMNEQKAELVADEGYETAHDILFPKRVRRGRKFKYNRG